MPDPAEGAAMQSRAANMTVSRTCPWDSRLSIDISIPWAPSTFLYASATFPIDWFRFFPAVDTIFLYYEIDVHKDVCEKVDLLHGENKTVFAVLDPLLPNNRTLLDLFYDPEALSAFTMELAATVSNLTHLGVDGFVLGDEWPRGCSQDVGVRTLAAHNETYFAETGRWMKPGGGDRVERAQPAAWLYRRSIQAWNSIARDLRNSFPGVRLGTNVDLFWRPDYGSDDPFMWKADHWLPDLNVGAYDFIVSHYYTAMPLLSTADDVDQSSLKILDSSLDRMLAATERQEKALYLMLAAHYREPWLITPAQMLAEWNLVSRKNISAIGWFAFDSWETGRTARWREANYVGGQAPFKVERPLLIRALSSAREEAILEDHLRGLTASCEPSIISERPGHSLEEEKFVSASFSPTARFLLLVSKTRIQVRNASEPSTILLEIRARGGLFASADWSPDETHLVYTTTDGELVILATGLPNEDGPPGHKASGEPAGEERHRLALARLGRVAWCPMGGTIACEAGGGILLMNVSNEHLDPKTSRWVIAPGDQATYLCGWSHDGTYLATRENDRLDIWNVKDLTLAAAMDRAGVGGPGHAGVFWSPKGDLLAVLIRSVDREELAVLDVERNITRIWGLRMGRSQVVNGTLILSSMPPGTNMAEAWRLAANVRTAWIYIEPTINGTWTVGQPADGGWMWEFRGTLARVACVAWNARGDEISVCTEDGCLFQISPLDETGPPPSITLLPLTDGGATRPAGWLPAIACDAFQPLAAAPPVVSLSFSPAEIAGRFRWVACRTDKVFVGPMGRPFQPILGAGAISILEVAPPGPARALDWSDHHGLLAASFGEPENSIRLWKVEPDGSSTFLFSLWDEEGPREIAFSPAGDGLAFLTDAGRLKLWNLANGQVSILYDLPPALEMEVRSISYSPDGKWLAFTSNCAEVAVLNLLTLDAAPVAQEAPFYAAWAPDGTILAIASSEGISLWSIDDSGTLRLLEHPTCGPARCLAWSPDGRYLLVGLETSREGLTDIQLFHWSGEDLLLLATKTIAFDWEPDQCQRLFAWSPDSLTAAVAFGLEEYNDPWREEWVKSTAPSGLICLRSVKFYFDKLRPGVILWDASAEPSNLSSFPTLSDAIISVVWLGEGGFLASASGNGQVLLWDVGSFLPVDETGPLSQIALIASAWLILSARRPRRRPGAGAVSAGPGRLECAHSVLRRRCVHPLRGGRSSCGSVSGGSGALPAGR